MIKKNFLSLLVLTVLVINSCSLESKDSPKKETFFTITFNSNWGTGEMSPLKVKKDDSVKLTKNSFTNGSLIFSGWNTTTDGTGIAFTNESSISMSNSDVILYAQWTKEPIFRTKWKITDNLLQFPILPENKNNFQIDWGDGHSQIITKADIKYRSNAYYIEHSYKENGEYIVEIKGICNDFGYISYVPSNKPQGILLDILEWGMVRLHNSGFQFFGCTELKSFSAKDTLDTSKITIMTGMFCEATNFNGDISKWITQNVTNMSHMFLNVTNFNCGGIDISKWKWNVDNVKNGDMLNMFAGTKLENNKPSWYKE